MPAAGHFTGGSSNDGRHRHEPANDKPAELGGTSKLGTPLDIILHVGRKHLDLRSTIAHRLAERGDDFLHLGAVFIRHEPV